MDDLTKHSLAEEDLLSRLNDIWVNPNVTQEDIALFTRYTNQLSTQIRTRISGLKSYHGDTYVITHGFDLRDPSILHRFDPENPQILCLTKAYPVLDALYDLQLHPMTTYQLDALKAMHYQSLLERDQALYVYHHDHTNDQYGLLDA